MKLAYTYLFFVFLTSLIAAEFETNQRLLISGDFMDKKNWNEGERPKVMDSVLMRGGNSFVLDDDFTKRSKGQIYYVGLGHNAADHSQPTIFDFKEGAYLLTCSNFVVGPNSDVVRTEPTTPVTFNMSGGKLVCSQFILGGINSDMRLGLSLSTFNMTGGIIRANRLFLSTGEKDAKMNLTSGKILLGPITDLVNYEHDVYYEPATSFSIRTGERSQLTVNWNILNRDYTKIIIAPGTTSYSDWRNAIINFDLSLLQNPTDLILIDNRGTGQMKYEEVTFNFNKLAAHLKAEITKGDGNDWVLSITKK